METTTNSPSQRIYKLYDDYAERGLDTSSISHAIQKMTGTSGKSNAEVVEEWLAERKRAKYENSWIQCGLKQKKVPRNAGLR